MLHGDTIAALRSWEQQFPVLDWTLHGLHVWPLIRTRMASRLLAAGAPARAPQKEDSATVSQRPLETARATRPRAQSRKADAVFLGRPANRQYIDGVWYDRLFDPIADVLEADGRSAIHLEYRPTGGITFAPRHRPAVVVRAAVTRRNILAAIRALRPARLEAFQDFSKAVEARHPGVPVVSPLWIARQARSVDLVARYFERIMRESEARVACCSVYYTLVGMAFCLAARRAGIPSVDIQHGVTAGNPAYEGWSRVPSDGYALVPSRFWCWSERDARPVRTWPAPGAQHHRAFVGGHPWIALWTSGQPLVSRLRAQLPSGVRKSTTVLVTLNWSSGFSDLLKELILQSPADWHWWIRLHPLMARERGAIKSWCVSEAVGRAEVDASTDLPLPLLVEAADVHLTHNSTVIQEAARLGKASVVVDSRALDVYTDELSSGWALFADDVPSAIRAIERQRVAPAALAPLDPYPSWSEMTRVVRALVADGSCLATASAASSPTPARV